MDKLRLFNSSHLEVKRNFTEDFQTDPYETGWALECIFFIMVEAIQGIDSKLVASVEISNDGINWVGEGSISETIKNKGLHFIKVKHFGNWLRLNCKILGRNPLFRLNIQIALKE